MAKLRAMMSISRRVLSKVPEVTVYFWLIKVLSTTVGETAADSLNADLGFGLTGTSLLMAALLLVALAVQFTLDRYVPWVYWVTVVLVSVVGTLISDNLVDNYGVPLETTTAVFGGALIATFAVWYACERTLSIHSITTPRRELFYWLAILFTFALGTAAGDLIAEKMGLGYLPATLGFLAVIAAVAVAHYGLRLGAVLAFWIAYVLTRPLGASLGDLLSQDRSQGGLGLGATTTSFAFLAVIVALVALLTITRVDRIDGRVNHSPHKHQS